MALAKLKVEKPVRNRSPDQHDRFQAWTVSGCSPHCGKRTKHEAEERPLAAARRAASARSAIEPGNGEKSEVFEASKGPYPCPTTASEEPKSPKPCGFLQNTAIRTETKTLPDDLTSRKQMPYVLSRPRNALPEKLQVQAPKQPEPCSSCPVGARSWGKKMTAKLQSSRPPVISPSPNSP